MRCRYCSLPAGWWRCTCSECHRLADVFSANRGADMGRMMELFIATGAPRVKVERFLQADLDSNGSVRDQIAADMANQLMEALGQTGRKTPDEVSRIRRRGAWVHLGERPRERPPR